MAVRLGATNEVSGLPEGVVLENDDHLTLDERIAKLNAQKQFESDFAQKFNVSIVEKGKPVEYECHFDRKTGSSPFVLWEGVNRPVVEIVNLALGKGTMAGLEQSDAIQILTHFVKSKYPFIRKTPVAPTIAPTIK